MGLCALRPGDGGQGEVPGGDDAPKAVFVWGPPEYGGGTAEAGAGLASRGSIKGNLIARVAWVPDDGVAEGCVDGYESVARDILGGGESARVSSTTRAAGEGPGRVGGGRVDPWWPRPPSRTRQWPYGRFVVAGEHSNDCGCRGEGGCDWPEPVQVIEGGRLYVWWPGGSADLLSR
jgi:hypothetical protein